MRGVSVEVNWKRIRASHRDLGGDGRLILELTSPDPMPIGVLDDAIEDAPFPVDEGPANGGWMATPTAAYLLLEADGYGGVEDWIQALVDRLTAAGVTGTLTGARAGGRVSWAIEIEDYRYKFSAMTCYRPLPSATPQLRWGGEEDLKAAVVRHGLDWALEGADPVTVWNKVSLRVDPHAAASLTQFFMDSSSEVGVTGYNKTRRQVRTMNFHSSATIELSEPCLDPASWPDAVAQLRTQILTAPREGLLLSQISPHDWHTRHAGGSRTPYVHDHSTFWRYPDLYAEWIPDPCGIQILTNAHLAKARDLTNWTLTELDADHWLVEAKDLAAWYATPIGPFDYHRPELIARARADFGDMILTHDLALALGFRKI